MKNYSELSDFEINKAVAESIELYVDSDKPSVDAEVYCGVDKDGCKYGWSFRDYCNNPSDAWPIIVEQRITVTPYDKVDSGWFATTDTSFFVDDINPLRAAMIVYLMMKDNENA